MARIVVVASSDVDREALREVVSPDDELFVVVPAVEQSRLQWLANEEDEARAEAVEVAEEIADSAAAEPVHVEAKPDHPSQLVLDAVAQYHPDRVVLALREGEDATWMEEGELDAVPSAVNGVPVVRLAL